jgi:hypothetical protein
MFPVAFGMFQSETEENWEWFMRQMHRSIGDVSPLAISTDACKGLANAVQTVFPHAELCAFLNAISQKVINPEDLP